MESRGICDHIEETKGFLKANLPRASPSFIQIQTLRKHCIEKAQSDTPLLTRGTETDHHDLHAIANRKHAIKNGNSVSKATLSTIIKKTLPSRYISKSYPTVSEKSINKEYNGYIIHEQFRHSM